jgi:hypothetical protein
MLIPRVSLSGQLAALLALMVQLAVGATVPRLDPVMLADAPICHSDAGGSSGGPATPPGHSPDCLLCPLCVAIHAPAIAEAPPGVVLPNPSMVVVSRSELPPPSRAPPAFRRPPNQPRAPPGFS